MYDQRANKRSSGDCALSKVWEAVTEFGLWWEVKYPWVGKLCPARLPRL